MKKSIRLMLALVAALSLFAAACGSDSVTDDVVDAADDAAAAGDAGLVYDIGGRGDLSFNDSAAAGLEKAAAELGYATTEASPNDDGSNRAELLQLAADSNEIVLAVGFLFAGDAAEAAAAVAAPTVATTVAASVAAAENCLPVHPKAGTGRLCLSESTRPPGPNGSFPRNSLNWFSVSWSFFCVPAARNLHSPE